MLLRWARHGYRIAEQRAEARLVALYESEDPSAIDAIFGATNLNDILDRLETIHATTALDRHLVQQVQSKREVLDQARGGHRERARAPGADSPRAHPAPRADRGATREAPAAARLRPGRGSATEGAGGRAAGEADRRGQGPARGGAGRGCGEGTGGRESRGAGGGARGGQGGCCGCGRSESEGQGRDDDHLSDDHDRDDDHTSTTTAPTTTVPTTTTDPNDLPPSVNLVTAPGHPQAATIAMQYLGVPYVWGGASPTTGFDCSGLVMYVYAQLGIALPHFAAAQYGMGVAVPRNQLQPGDLVFFDNLNHVGISLGGNLFIDAPHTGDVVKISTITGWYQQNYVGARRI